MIRRLVLAVLVVGVLPACGGGDDDSTPTDGAPASDATQIVLEFEDGEFVGDVRREDVSLGDPVEVVVLGGRDEQVHVHGYDLYIEPDDSDSTLEFDALIPGRFEIELEESGRLLLEITVS